MIIQCINCDKRFEVSSALIPLKGRSIQCGSCNHTWFYKPSADISPKDLLENNNEIMINDNNQGDNKNEIIINDNSTQITKSINKTQIKKTSNFTIGKVLSFFLVCIITFIALIIILDTFESSLSSNLPSLELFLYNFFETIKDIDLFLKDLFL